MPLILGTNSIKDTGFNVANSLRFNSGSSDYLSRSTGVTTTNTKFTLSFWIKLCDTANYQQVFEVYKSSSERINCGFNLDNANQPRFFIQEYTGSYIYRKIFTRLSRDVSAWTHYVIKFDSSEAEANRLRVYINGVEETATDQANLPGSGATSIISVGTQHIGYSQNNSGHYLNGYLAEFVLIEGTDYDPTSFGEFDEDSPTIWKPKDVSGLTFGTNGFYLDFEDSSALGNDVSGNNNDFSVNNLTSIDQTTDTCTNNFATLNSLVNFNSGVFSEGNCAITYGDDTISTIGVTKGRWYWEAQRTNTATEAHFGIGLSKGFYSATSIVSDGDRLYTRSGTTYFSAVSNLNILTFGSNSGTSAAVGNGDVISFYLDLESSTKNITIKKNDGATPIVNVDLTYSGAEPIFAFCRMNSGCSSSWNFGNPIAALSSANSDPNGYGSFEYSTTLNSVDYYALCTKNLAEFG